jgi:hypothetical protein
MGKRTRYEKDLKKARCACRVLKKHAQSSPAWCGTESKNYENYRAAVAEWRRLAFCAQKARYRKFGSPWDL